jgi:hypothetical protein
MSTTLSLYVDDIAAAMSSYDTMQVRKADLEAGPWTPLTSDIARPAVIEGSVSGPYTVSGMTLQLQVNRGTPHSIVFSGTDPLSVNAVAAQINAVFTGLASELGGKLKLQTTQTGTQARIDILAGSANPVLGFIEGDLDIGEEPYVTLVSGINSYNFYDRDGISGQFYEVAFYNTVNLQSSAWSDPFQGEPGTVIDASNLSTGSIDLVDASGVSKPDQVITFFPMWEPLSVEGFKVAMTRDPISITTNNSGHAEVVLVRGLKVKAVFEGTSYTREFVVPDAPTFNILDLMSTAPDPFNPYEPDYPTAPRRTL